MVRATYLRDIYRLTAEPEAFGWGSNPLTTSRPSWPRAGDHNTTRQCSEWECWRCTMAVCGPTEVCDHPGPGGITAPLPEEQAAIRHDEDPVFAHRKSDMLQVSHHSKFIRREVWTSKHTVGDIYLYLFGTFCAVKYRWVRDIVKTVKVREWTQTWWTGFVKGSVLCPPGRNPILVPTYSWSTRFLS